LNLKTANILTEFSRKKKPSELVLKVGERPDTVLRKEQIAKWTKAPSSMPEMKNLLTKREIRDLVSFLSTLKEDQ
jgi:hypothetical protein